MISALGLPYVVKSQKNKFIQPRKFVEYNRLRYIPEWFLPKEAAGSFEDFMLKFKKQYGYPWKSLKKIARNIIQNNFPIGQGRHSKVYEIPGINDYVLKVSKGTKLGFFDFVKGLKKAKNEYYGFNFGQAVADNKNGLSILMRVNGDEYGIKNWYDCYRMAKYPSQEEIDKFIQHDMAKLSEFPQESFDNLAKKIALVRAATKSQPDLYNPNNFVIDYKNKTINIVDVNEDNDSFWTRSLGGALTDSRFIITASKEAFANAEKYIAEIKYKSNMAEDSHRNAFVWDYALKR